jgi:hypothetical protein
MAEHLGQQGHRPIDVDTAVVPVHDCVNSEGVADVVQTRVASPASRLDPSRRDQLGEGVVGAAGRELVAGQADQQGR